MSMMNRTCWNSEFWFDFNKHRLNVYINIVNNWKKMHLFGFHFCILWIIFDRWFLESSASSVWAQIHVGHVALLNEVYFILFIPAAIEDHLSVLLSITFIMYHYYTIKSLAGCDMNLYRRALNSIVFICFCLFKKTC